MQQRPGGLGVAGRLDTLQQRQPAVRPDLSRDALLPETELLVRAQQRREGGVGAGDEVVPRALQPRRVGKDVRALPDALAAGHSGAVVGITQHPRQAPVHGYQRGVAVEGIQ
jgi:hypothetical protein